jgi:hypothetical protein
MATEWLPNGYLYLLPHHANDVWVANEYSFPTLKKLVQNVQNASAPTTPSGPKAF